MTDPRRPAPAPAPRGGSGCLVLIGGILLLPGACALMFVGSNPQGLWKDPQEIVLVLAALAVSAFGFVLILRQ